MELARALFAPRAVALVGASADPAKNTGRPQRFLARHGYRGEVYPVNPGRDEVQGRAAYPRISEIPGPVDHALIMVPRQHVAAALRDCGAHGVPVATVYSDGFADLGSEEGRERQDALLAIAREVGVRIIGPNSMGVFSFGHGLTLSVNAILEMSDIPVGRTGVISQSGSILGSLLSRGTARGIGFSKMVSVGNEADLGVGEILDMMVADPDTSAVALFLESLRGADALAAAARRAHAAGKPVVAYKLGRSDLGRTLAATHSGAMTGDAQVADAFFEAHGIARVSQFETLLEALPLLGAGAAPRRRRVTVLTTTGGGAATVVDRLGEAGIETVPAAAPVAEMLAEHGIDVAGKAIVDLTLAGARREIFTAVLRRLMEDERSDAVVVVVGSSGQFHPEITVEPIVECLRPDRPLGVYIVPDAPRSLRLLADAGVAAFRTPEACADALRALLAWHPPAARVEATGAVAEAMAPALAVSEEGGALGEAECYPVFEALGIPVAPHARLAADAAPALPEGLAFPVVLKLASRQITHKSDVGGVAVGLADPAALVDAHAAMVRGIRERDLEAQVDGYLVQSMCTGIGEAVIAYRRDPEVGPLVSVGLGGRLTELYRDVAVRVAPVSPSQARAMVSEVRGLRVLEGFRGAPRGDVEALVAAVCALSHLAHVDAARVVEAEINPLVVHAEGEGVTAVDGVLVLSQSA